mmetsp:Transcript_78452/g.138632  ORF Transcript_78452/g.138632 Transcript_78452/m.138632 type:complete len:234 (-) Transcript_78452:3-704(-)
MNIWRQMATPMCAVFVSTRPLVTSVIRFCGSPVSDMPVSNGIWDVLVFLFVASPVSIEVAPPPFLVNSLVQYTTVSCQRRATSTGMSVCTGISQLHCADHAPTVMHLQEANMTCLVSIVQFVVPRQTAASPSAPPGLAHQAYWLVMPRTLEHCWPWWHGTLRSPLRSRRQPVRRTEACDPADERHATVGYFSDGSTSVLWVQNRKQAERGYSAGRAGGGGGGKLFPLKKKNKG